MKLKEKINSFIYTAIVAFENKVIVEIFNGEIVLDNDGYIKELAWLFDEVHVNYINGIKNVIIDKSIINDVYVTRNANGITVYLLTEFSCKLRNLLDGLDEDLNGYFDFINNAGINLKSNKHTFKVSPNGCWDTSD